MIIRFIIVALFCVCVGLKNSSRAEYLATSNSVLSVKSETKAEKTRNPWLLSSGELIEVCSNKLNDIEWGLGSGSNKSDIDMHRAIRIMRQNGAPEFVGVLKQIIESPASEAKEYIKKEKEYIKTDALRALYAVTGDKNLIRPWLNGNSEMLKAAALEILAPVCVGEQWFDQMLDEMLKKDRSVYWGTPTVDVIRQIIPMRTFRQSYESETNVNKKVDLLVKNISWLCDETPPIDGSWYISDDVFAQYLLRQFRLRALDNNVYTKSAIRLYMDKAPARSKPLAEILLKAIDMPKDDHTTGYMKEFRSRRASEG